jgi:membrane protein required for colicin V production
MEVYDVIMLAVLLGATVFGAWKGLVWQLASLGAIVASYFVALEFRDEVAPYLKATPPWNVFLAMLILYVGTSLIIWLAFRLASRFVDRLKLKEFDRQIGALFGFAKGVLLCVIITLFAVTLLGESQRQAIVRSRSGYYIAQLLDRSHAVMPPEVRDVLHPYMHSLDERLDATGLTEPPIEPYHHAAERAPAHAVGEVLRAWDELAPAPSTRPIRR